eukprot:783925-Prymnesium_polylepis.1
MGGGEGVESVRPTSARSMASEACRRMTVLAGCCGAAYAVLLFCQPRCSGASCMAFGAAGLAGQKVPATFPESTAARWPMADDVARGRCRAIRGPA